LEKAKCIIDQYGNYTATEVGLKVSNWSKFSQFFSIMKLL
jgi:hypothetical protein